MQLVAKRKNNLMVSQEDNTFALALYLCHNQSDGIGAKEVELESELNEEISCLQRA